jgi:hypothetical protein
MASTVEASNARRFARIGRAAQAFRSYNYPNEIGPGIHDFHSPRVPTLDEMHDLSRLDRRAGRSAVRYRTSGLSMGKLLARNFRRKFVALRLVAVRFVLRRRNWNSATLAVLNQHLAITRQIQTLGHVILPYARPSKD